MKSSTDTISNMAAQHCKVQPRKPWDMIPLLGSFIGGSHGRVEAQETDPDFFAGRKRSICGGQCGDQVKPLGLHSDVCVSTFQHTHWVVSPHSLCSGSFTLYTFHSNFSSNKQRPLGLPLLSCWRCGRRRTTAWSQLWST